MLRLLPPLIMFFDPLCLSVLSSHLDTFRGAVQLCIPRSEALKALKASLTSTPSTCVRVIHQGQWPLVHMCRTGRKCVKPL